MMDGWTFARLNVVTLTHSMSVISQSITNSNCVPSGVRRKGWRMERMESEKTKAAANSTMGKTIQTHLLFR